jgi:hypothetical protein
VAHRYRDEERLAASFFFSRGGGDVGHADKFVTTIAVQLARSVPAVLQHISNAVAEHSDVASQSLRDQWQELVLCPLSKLHKEGPEPETYVVVVDALDECDSDDNIRIIVRLLAEARSPLMGVRLRVLLTSRPEVPIRHGFRQVADTQHKNVVLHDMLPSVIEHDLSIFFRHHLKIIAKECYQADGWPGAEAIGLLLQSASGLFIWAATACRFIQGGKRFAAKRLQTILCNNDARSGTPEMHLNGMYTTVLQNSIQEYTNEEREEQCSATRYVLGSIVLLTSPLPLGSLSALLRVRKHEINQTLENLHAILDIPDDENQSLRLHHPSFRDFLLDKTRCHGEDFWVDDKLAHIAIAEKCLQLMSRALKQDICGIKAPGTLAADAEKDRVAQCIKPELEYACVNWIQHLAKGCAQLRDGDQVELFLKEHFLHWLEALGWLGKVSEGVHAISLLESSVLVSPFQKGTD